MNTIKIIITLLILLLVNCEALKKRKLACKGNPLCIIGIVAIANSTKPAVTIAEDCVNTKGEVTAAKISPDIEEASVDVASDYNKPKDNEKRELEIVLTGTDPNKNYCVRWSSVNEKGDDAQNIAFIKVDPVNKKKATVIGKSPGVAFISVFVPDGNFKDGLKITVSQSVIPPPPPTDVPPTLAQANINKTEFVSIPPVTPIPTIDYPQDLQQDPEIGSFFFQSGIQDPVASVTHNSYTYYIFASRRQWANQTILTPSDPYWAYDIWVSPMSSIAYKFDGTPLLTEAIQCNSNSEIIATVETNGNIIKDQMCLFELPIQILTKSLKRKVIQELNYRFKIDGVPAAFQEKQVRALPFNLAELSIEKYGIKTLYPQDFDYKLTISPLALRFENSISFRFEMPKKVGESLIKEINEKRAIIKVRYVLNGLTVTENRLNVFASIMKNSKLKNYLKGVGDFQYNDNSLANMNSSSSSNSLSGSVGWGPFSAGASSSNTNSSKSDYSANNAEIKTYVSREIVNAAIAKAMENTEISKWIEDPSDTDFIMKHANQFSDYLLNKFAPANMSFWNQQGEVLQQQLDGIHKDFSPHRITSLSKAMSQQINNSNNNEAVIGRDLLSSIGLKKADDVFKNFKMSSGTDMSSGGSSNSSASNFENMYKRKGNNSNATSSSYQHGINVGAQIPSGLGGSVGGSTGGSNSNQTGSSYDNLNYSSGGNANSDSLNYKQYKDGLVVSNEFLQNGGYQYDETKSSKENLRQSVAQTLSAISDTSFGVSGDMIVPKSINMNLVSDQAFDSFFQGNIIDLKVKGGAIKYLDHYIAYDYDPQDYIDVIEPGNYDSLSLMSCNEQMPNYGDFHILSTTTSIGLDFIENDTGKYTADADKVGKYQLYQNCFPYLLVKVDTKEVGLGTFTGRLDSISKGWDWEAISGYYKTKPSQFKKEVFLYDFVLNKWVSPISILDQNTEKSDYQVPFTKVNINPNDNKLYVLIKGMPAYNKKVGTIDRAWCHYRGCPSGYHIYGNDGHNVIDLSGNNLGYCNWASQCRICWQSCAAFVLCWTDCAFTSSFTYGSYIAAQPSEERYDSSITVEGTNITIISKQ